MNLRKIAEISFICIVIITVILLILKVINITISLTIIVILVILFLFIKSEFGGELTFKIFGQLIRCKWNGPSQTKSQEEDIEIQGEVIEEIK